MIWGSKSVCDLLTTDTSLRKSRGLFFFKANRHLNSLELLRGEAWCWRALIGGTQVQKEHVVILIGMYSWNLGCGLPGSTEVNKRYELRFLQKWVLFPLGVLLYWVTFTCGIHEIHGIFLGTTEGASTALGVSVMWQLSCSNPKNKDHKTPESMISAYTGDVSWRPGPPRPPRWPSAETTQGLLPPG